VSASSRPPVELPSNAVLQSLVDANHVLAKMGIVDGFGHVSIRHPERDDAYVISRSLAPEVVTIDDLQVFYLDGLPANDDLRHPYLERPIHGSIYSARPDVSAICHNHVPSVIPFSVTATPLRPIYHMASLIGSTVPVWDIAAEFGETTNMLVMDAAKGDSLARGLGSASMVLMRGHGCTIVGPTLGEVVLASIYADENAQIQLNASSLGSTRALSDGEIHAAAELLRQPGAMEKAWQSLRARLQGAG
jgi:HCOMODA/2-hydroxy-3-carboxy-muconic semialdehyde decarboxylase